jgi:hypothetical protein
LENRGGRNRKAALVDAADKRGFLARKEARRRADGIDRQSIDACGPAGCQRSLELVSKEPQARQIQISAVSADCLSGQLQPVEHEVRRRPEQELVLLTRRLALCAVSDNYRTPACVQDGGQLGCRWEAGAASTSEAGGVHLPDQPCLAPAVRQAAEPIDMRDEIVNRFAIGWQQARRPARSSSSDVRRRGPATGGLTAHFRDASERPLAASAEALPLLAPIASRWQPGR